MGEILRRYQRWLALVGIFIVLLAFVVLFIVRDVRTTVLIAQKQLVAESAIRLSATRDSYTNSAYASWVGSWTDLVDRLAGSGVLRISRRQSTLPLNRDLLSYPFDSPACRRFDKTDADALIACAIYNMESRRLQIVATWHESDWAVVEEGDVDPAKGDRVALRIPGLLEGEYFASPQLPKNRRDLAAACASDWSSEPQNPRCGEIPIAVYNVLPNHLLGRALSGSNGIAFRTLNCPAGVVAPCVRMLLTLLTAPPKTDAYVCVAQRDARTRQEHSVVAIDTCDGDGQMPRPGLFLDAGLKWGVSRQETACGNSKTCLCKEVADAPSSCVAIDTQLTAEHVHDESVNRSEPTVAGYLALTLIQAVNVLQPIPPSNANAAFLGAQSAQPVGYLVEHVPNRLAFDVARDAVAQRLALYAMSLLAPVLLFVAMAVALSRAAARTRAAQEQAERIREEAMRQKAEAARDEALATAALVEAALRNANTGLEDLGHEIISPAQSLMLVVDDLKRAVGEAAYVDLLGTTYIDLMQGYVHRITRASERVRRGLQLQRRQAESQRLQTTVELSRFLRRRLEAEQLVASLPYRFEGGAHEVRIIADSGDLEEILGNLLSNARRFSDGQAITVTLAAQGKSVELSIRNEGPIIGRGSEEAIFLMGASFAPADNEFSHGLGLFLVRVAVSAMGGTILAQNDPEPATHGVTFVLSFPIAHPAGGSANADRDAQTLST